MARFSISATPIDAHQLAGRMQNAAAGAFACFEGWVRDYNEGQTVTALAYEVFHDLAMAEGDRIVAEAIAKFNLVNAFCVHREGSLNIGDCAVWVGVTALHRGEAFAACREIIDAIKHRLPIWKKETYQTGETAWVNCQHHHKETAHHHHPVQPPTPLPSDYYDRQIRLPEIGQSGQQKLAAARILIVGVGGLGATAALSLAGAGIGTIGLAEPDCLEASNLHRQILYDAADIGVKKVTLAAARLRAHNPLIKIIEHDLRVTSETIADLFGAYDLILDCTDNFTTKYLLNDAAIAFNKTVIQASIYRNEGQLLIIDPASHTGCLRCLWPEPPPADAVGSCAETGVLGTVPVIFGALQAHKALAHILNLPNTAASHLTLLDLHALQTTTVERTRNLKCPVCGPTAKPIHFIGTPEFHPEPGITVGELSGHYQLIDVREFDEARARPLANAHGFPVSTFNLATFPFSAETPLLIICASGKRSLSITQRLRDAGYTHAYSLAGGIAKLPSEQQAA